MRFKLLDFDFMTTEQSLNLCYFGEFLSWLLLPCRVTRTLNVPRLLRYDCLRFVNALWMVVVNKKSGLRNSSFDETNHATTCGNPFGLHCEANPNGQDRPGFQNIVKQNFSPLTIYKTLRPLTLLVILLRPLNWKLLRLTHVKSMCLPIPFRLINKINPYMDKVFINE